MRKECASDHFIRQIGIEIVELMKHGHSIHIAPREHANPKAVLYLVIEVDDALEIVVQIDD